jgi:hypothetical protein
MFSYVINFFNLWNNLLPNNKRFETFKAWGKVLMTPLDYLQINTFNYWTYNEFQTIGTSVFWNSSDTYNVGDYVVGLDNSLYLCIQNTASGDLPTNTDYFTKINNDFIGVFAQLRYDSRIGMFEKALNVALGYATTLPNPPFQDTLNTNDRPTVYIDTNEINADIFLVGIDATDTVLVSLNSFDADVYVGLPPDSYNQNSFTIYYDSTLVPIDYTTTEWENKIKAIADTINLAGLQYNIESY